MVYLSAYLPAGRRFLGLVAAFTCYVLASPGFVTAGGSPVFGVLAVALWGAVVARPAPGRGIAGALVEVLVCGTGLGVMLLWIGYVYEPPLAWVALGSGLYALLGGWLVRRLAPRVGLGLAVATGWLAFETLRELLPAPLGLGWIRLAHFASDSFGLVESVRLFGPEGLGFVLAAVAGGLASLVFVAAERKSLRLNLLPGALGLVVAFAAGPLTRPAPALAGPRVLCVQPGFSQERKQHNDARQNLLDSLALTAEAVAAEARAGHPPADLVCWGETMMVVPLYLESVRAAFAADPGLTHPGLRGLSDLALVDDNLDWFTGALLGRGGLAPILPPGAAFVSGVEVFDALEGEIRRKNALVLLDAEGRRAGLAYKQNLVPGAETMYGLQRFAAVRATILEVAGYLPDLVAGDETGIFEFETRSGARYRFSGTVCFDNAFLGAYVEAAAAGPLDFHLIASNEAWYQGSFELDQMIAFSRVIALATAKAVVRATNSGVTIALGPDGRELGRARDGGRDRSVSAWLAVDLPVPPLDAKAARTPYVSLLWVWRALALGGAWALLGGLRIRSRNPRSTRG